MPGGGQSGGSSLANQLRRQQGAHAVTEQGIRLLFQQEAMGLDQIRHASGNLRQQWLPGSDEPAGKLHGHHLQIPGQVPLEGTVAFGRAAGVGKKKQYHAQPPMGVPLSFSR